MFDFSKLQNPIAGEAQNIADIGDIVSVRTKQGTLRCEALTEITSIDVIVFKDKKGNNYVLGQTTQTITEETTQIFKSRPQPSRPVGVFEIVTIFAEHLDGDIDFVTSVVRTAITGRQVNGSDYCAIRDEPAINSNGEQISTFIGIDSCTSATNFSAVTNRKIKFWMKINSVSNPIELIEFNYLQKVNFVWHIDENFIYVTFKTGTLDTRSYYNQLGFNYNTINALNRDLVPDPAHQVDIFIFNLKGSLIARETFKEPSDINFNRINYFANKYAYNYGVLGTHAATLATIFAPTTINPIPGGGSFLTGELIEGNQFDINYYNESSVCKRRAIAPKRHFIDLEGTKFINQITYNQSSPFDFDAQAAPGSNNWSNFFNQVLFEAKMRITQEQRDRANVGFQQPFNAEDQRYTQGSLLGYGNLIFNIYASETTYLEVSQFNTTDDLRNFGNNTVIDGVLNPDLITPEFVTNFSGNNVTAFVAPIEITIFDENYVIPDDPTPDPLFDTFTGYTLFNSQDPLNPDNQFCNLNASQEFTYLVILNRLVPENFNGLNIANIAGIYGSALINTLPRRQLASRGVILNTESIQLNNPSVLSS